MATAFTHAFVAIAAGVAIYSPRPMPKKFWILAPICSAAPDLDVGLHAYGVDYADAWGHRGMMHSVFFAVIIGVALVAWFFRRDFRPLSRPWFGMCAFFAAIIASHGFIDAFTSGGEGIAFFAPFSHERYFMPWNPIEVSPMGVRGFFTQSGAEAIISELLWVWLPVSVVAACVYFARRLVAKSADPS
ncbi:MAG: metal-dependent hydrolase [Phycisphaerae bacterium]|nr:metal-dependent hydrolase [Phycisphaerae bacterium]